MLKFPLCSLGQVETSAHSLGRAVSHLTAEQALGTAGRTLAEVCGLPAPACAPRVLVEGHLHPCSGWNFNAQLGAMHHVTVLLVGLLGEVSLVQSLLEWRMLCGGGILCRESWTVERDVPLYAQVCWCVASLILPLQACPC